MTYRLAFAFLLIFGAGCNEWEYPQEFPIVLTQEVRNISASGAEFSGRIESVVKGQNILRYGFVWDDSEAPTLASSVYSISENTGIGTYTKRIEGDLKNTKVYQVRAFAQTDLLVIYGNTVTFTSQGSLPPLITDFTPKEGVDGTEVTIYGQHFSMHPEGNLVKVGSAMCEVIASTESELKVLIPTTDLVGDYPFSLTVAGITTVSTSAYTIPGPRIRSISKLTGRVGDLLTIEGEYFDSQSYMDLYFGPPEQFVPNYSLPYVISESVLECYVPDHVNTTTNIELVSYSPQFDVKKHIYPESFTIIQSWSKLSSNTPLGEVEGLSTVSAGDVAYFIGEGKIAEFNAATKVWTMKAAFPGPVRNHGTAFILQDAIYYGFGHANGKFYNDLWIYYPTSDRWEFFMNTPIAERAAPVSFVINDKAYLGFGYSNIQFTAYSLHDFWEFNPATQKWTKIQAPTKTSPAQSGSAFAVGTKGYVMGLDMRDTWEFDPVLARWKQMSDFPEEVYNAGPSTFSDTKGYLFSRSQYGGGNRLYEYDPERDRWIKKQIFPGSGRAYAAAALVGNEIYYGTGKHTNSHAFTPDFWQLILK